jgi:four helix bundle protein
VSGCTKEQLIERTGNIGKSTIQLCKIIDKSVINNPLISQIVRSSTSIGANYCEATEANSKKDFVNKVVISKKEAKETLHWLEMIKSANPELSDKIDSIKNEVHEIILIFSATVNSCKRKSI